MLQYLLIFVNKNKSFLKTSTVVHCLFMLVHSA